MNGPYKWNCPVSITSYLVKEKTVHAESAELPCSNLPFVNDPNCFTDVLFINV